MRKRAGLLLGLLLAGCGHETLKPIDIFFVADVQGFYYARPEPRLDNRDAGGYGILKNFLAAQPEGFLLFDGGNWSGAGAEGMLFKGSYLPELVATLPFTAGTLTDKDLVYGWPTARNIVKELPYPFVVSNLKLDNQIPWPMHDYQIRTLQGIKIGIFGIMAPLQKDRERLPGLTVLDPVETAQQMVTLLKEKGVDYLIMLSSLGITDEKGVSDAALAAEVEGIDLILSSNRDSETPETETIKHTFVVYPGSRLDSVGHIVVSFDKNKQVKNVKFTDEPLLQETYGEDEQIAARSATLLNDTRNHMKRRLTQTAAPVPGDLKNQSPLGSLLSQCLHKWAKLDGAVLNAASIRTALPQGELTEFDLYKTYPYGDNITFLTIKGAAFTRALEASLNAEDNFPQIAGFNVQYRVLPNGYKQIMRITLDNGRIVRPDDTYRFAVTDHILAGGFGHEEFINALEFKSTFVEARQIMRACLVRQKTLEVPPSEGRWRKVL